MLLKSQKLLAPESENKKSLQESPGVLPDILSIQEKDQLQGIIAT
jgi:hypothetical protein